MEIHKNCAERTFSAVTVILREEKYDETRHHKEWMEKSHKIMYTNEKETAIEGNCNICTEKSNRKRTAVSFMLYVQIICCANNFFFIVLASRSLFASCSGFRADLSLQSGEEYLREMQKVATDFFAFEH